MVALDWPVTTDDGERLFLVLSGYIARIKGPITTVCISRNELLGARELTRCFELFSKHTAHRLGSRRPLLVPMALVDEDDQAHSAIAAIVTPHGWTIERADPESARKLLQAGFPPICLLVTRNVELLQALGPDVSAVLTVDRETPAVAEAKARRPRLVVMRKPLIYGELRRVITEICEQMTAPPPARASEARRSGSA